MDILINKAHYPVTVLGPGRRVGIWLQGCSIGCPHCISRDTWSPDAARAMPLSQLLAWCQDPIAQGCEGVTLSGGEPFDQPLALLHLLNGLQQLSASASPFDILCYSGYPFRHLKRHFPDHLARIDVLIPEPYRDHQPTAAPWRGSANQPLIALSPRARQRYAAWMGEPDAGPADTGANHASSADKRLQFVVDGTRIWFVGIPARGDLEKMAQSCRSRGIELQEASWRP